MASWFQLTVDVPADLLDVVSGFLFDLGCSGLQVDDGPDPSRARLTAYFPPTEAHGHVESALRQQLQSLPGVGSGTRTVGQDVELDKTLIEGLNDPTLADLPRRTSLLLPPKPKA